MTLMTRSLISLIAMSSLLGLGAWSGSTHGALLAQAEYQIGSADVLTVTVFGEPDFSGKYTVAQDGSITYPQIGRVKAGGLTLRAIEAELKRQLADGYLRNPQVSVSIETYKSQRILVLGEVRSPGEYQLTGEMTLLSALLRAGSTTTLAGREVLVVRAARSGVAASAGAPVADATGTIRIDLSKLQAGDATLNVMLQDGDTVNVPKAQLAFVSGQVRSPGAYGVERGMTVLQVIALAGGMTDRGSDSRIRILRNVDGKQKEIRVKLTDLVEPGDTVVVQERFF